MDRRSYLAGSTVGAVAFLSGCLDTAGLGVDERDDVTVPEDEDPVNAEIRSAVGTLNRAGLSLGGIDEDLEDPNAVEYDPERPRERIATAYDRLEAAEELGDRPEDVETLREFADVLERTIDAVVSLIAADLDGEFETAETHFENEEYDAAQTIVRDRNENVTNDQDRLDPAGETLETIDHDRLADLNAIDVDPLEDGVATLDHLLSGLGALTGSFDRMIDGSRHLDDGREAFEEGLDLTDEADEATTPGEADQLLEDADDAFEDALESFQNGETAFADSSSTLETLEDPPTALDEQFETTACRSGNLEAAAGEFVRGAEAALEDDIETARDHEGDGIDLIERAEDCGE